MSPAVVALLLLAGLSEAAGRIMPLLVCRPGVSPRNVVGLMLTGAIVEGAVLALWPLTAWTVAELLLTSPSADGTLEWTPGLLAPLLLAAVLAFPLLGPLLHLLLFAGDRRHTHRPAGRHDRAGLVDRRRLRDRSRSSARHHGGGRPPTGRTPQRDRCPTGARMNHFLLWASLLGPALLAEGLLARYEVLAYGAGWRNPSPRSPRACPTPVARHPTIPRKHTWSIWTASESGACATAATAANWSRP